jgi:hypothetical protein
MNRIKSSGEGVALQITKPARSAGFVDENSDGEATRLAAVRVYAFQDFLLAIDREQVNESDIADLVVAAAEDTDSIYRAQDASVQIAGDGYQLQLPVATDAGFSVDDKVGTHPANGVIAFSKAAGSDVSNAARLAKDIITIRESQLR